MNADPKRRIERRGVADHNPIAFPLVSNHVAIKISRVSRIQRDVFDIVPVVEDLHVVTGSRQGRTVVGRVGDNPVRDRAILMRFGVGLVLVFEDAP